MKLPWNWWRNYIKCSAREIEKRNSGDVKKISLLWHFLELCFKESDSSIDRNKNWHSTSEYSEWSWQKWGPQCKPSQNHAGITPTSGEAAAHCACHSVSCWAFSTGVFSAELRIDNSVKSEVVSTSLTCHWGRVMLHASPAPWAAVLPALSFPCFWGLQPQPFLYKQFPGVSGVGVGSAHCSGCLACISPQCLQSQLSRADSSVGKNSTRRPHLWCFLAINDWRAVIF